MRHRPLYGTDRRRVSVREFWNQREDDKGWRPGISRDASRIYPEPEKDTQEYVHKAIFTYSTSELSKTDRVRFFYGLKGRGGQLGLVEDCNGVHLGPGVILVAKRYSKVVEEFMESFGSRYIKRDIWVLQPSKRMRIRKMFEQRSVK